LKIGDRAAGLLKSEALPVVAAKMVCLDLDHPEIVNSSTGKGEEKESRCIDRAGYPSDYEGKLTKL
jgi:ribonucleoside-diphosphate reductase alpha chain